MRRRGGFREIFAVSESPHFPPLSLSLAREEKSLQRSRFSLFLACIEFTKMSKKAISASIRLLIGAGQAKPAPPVGPALGQAGLNIMAFCKDFNAATSGIKVSFLFDFCWSG